MANDWRLVYLEQFDSIQQARMRERQIKAWKSRKRMNLLIWVLLFLKLKSLNHYFKFYTTGALYQHHGVLNWILLQILSTFRRIIKIIKHTVKT